jgi:hypothetical protein
VEDQVVEARARLQGFRELLSSKGWALLGEILQRQIALRTDTIVLTPLKTADEAFEQEFKKGEVSGMKLFATLPKTVIDEITALFEQKEKEHARSDTSSTDGGADSASRPGSP